MPRASAVPALFVVATLALWPLSAEALVLFGEIAPGEVKLGYGWVKEEALTKLLKVRPSVGGHFRDAPTWWDGHFAADHYYQGREPDLQAVIDALDRLRHPHTKIIVVPGEEGFWDGDRMHQRKESLAYDWSLTVSETKMRDPAKYKHDGKSVVNEPVVILRVYLGDRLDRAKLNIPQRLLDNPRLPSGVAVVGREDPADALHALARAKRRD